MIRLDTLDAAAFATYAGGEMLPDGADGWLALRIPDGRTMGGVFLPVSSDMRATTLDRMVPYAARAEKWLNWTDRMVLTPPDGVATAPPERVMKLKSAAIVGGIWNFGHFLTNFAPRALAMRALLSAEDYAALSWLIPASSPPVYSEILTDMIGGTPTIIPVEDMDWVKADQLYAPGMLSFAGADNVSQRYDHHALMRARLRRAAGIAPTSPTRRVLMSRADAPKRRLLNEPALAAALAPYGFELARLEGLSWREQVRIIADAEHVVGTFGAGWAMNWLRRPGGGLTIIAPPSHGMGGEMQLDALMIGLNLRLATAEEHPGPHPPGDNDMSVDPDLVLAALRDLGAL